MTVYLAHPAPFLSLRLCSIAICFVCDTSDGLAAPYLSSRRQDSLSRHSSAIVSVCHVVGVKRVDDAPLYA